MKNVLLLTGPKLSASIVRNLGKNFIPYTIKDLKSAEELLKEREFDSIIADVDDDEIYEFVLKLKKTKEKKLLLSTEPRPNMLTETHSVAALFKPFTRQKFSVAMLLVS